MDQKVTLKVTQECSRSISALHRPLKLRRVIIVEGRSSLEAGAAFMLATYYNDQAEDEGVDEAGEWKTVEVEVDGKAWPVEQLHELTSRAIDHYHLA
jgi:hypothetical protein